MLVEGIMVKEALPEKHTKPPPMTMILIADGDGAEQWGKK